MLYLHVCFGNFFPKGDPRRNWFVSGEDHQTVESVQNAAERNKFNCELRGYSLGPSKIIKCDENGEYEVIETITKGSEESEKIFYKQFKIKQKETADG